MTDALRSPRRILAGRWAEVAVLASILFVYLPLVTLHAVPVSDDGFTSDLLDAELPARAEAGRLLAHGEAPTWTDRVDGGFPLLAGGGLTEPFGEALFTTLPPAAALDAYLLLLLSVAGLGGVAFARRLGATVSGSALAGLAFVHSGFVVCQLRHLGELSCAVWLPVGLALLERALDGAAANRREAARSLALFGLVFGEQVLAGFPQTAYASALAYGGWMLVRVASLPTRRARLATFGGFVLAGLAGSAMGAVALLPLAELGRLSDRASGVTLALIERSRYWLPQLSSFFVPYLHGDPSRGTFTGHGIFWEDDGYLGLLAVPLAIAALFGANRRRARLLWAMAVAALAVVVGPATPLFGLAFRFVPGMSTFRFPQRFLFVVELALATSAGLGLSALETWIGPRRWRTAAVAMLVALAFADEAHFNARQNPLDDASRWLSMPSPLTRLSADARMFTPDWKTLHRRAHAAARGWSGDAAALREVRAFGQPDLNLLWGLATLDGYSGIAPTWVVDVVGDHNRPGILRRQLGLDAAGRLELTPLARRLLAMNDVRFLLAAQDSVDADLKPFAEDGPVRVFEVADRLPRARLVARAERVASDAEAIALISAPGFDPSREVVVAADAPTAPEGGGGEAEIVGRTSTCVSVRTRASGPAWLVLAETFYPGWTATVDGRQAPVVRANLSQRAVPVPAGDHVVTFELRSGSVRRGLAVSLFAAMFLLGAAVAIRRRR